MKLTLLLVLTLGLAACSAPKTENATAEFAPMVEKVNAAWQTLDTANVAPFYAKDADLTFFDVAPLQYKGWQAYADGFKKVAADWQSVRIRVDPGTHAIKHGNIAVVNWTGSFTITPKSGSPMSGQIRGTEVLEKRDDKWLIVHEHVSAPMAEPAPPPPVEKRPAAKPKPAHTKKKK